MKLTDLLRDVAIEETRGPLDVEIADVRDDSRAVAEGDLFVALPGQIADGHAFLAAAARAGARAAVVERAIDAAAPAEEAPPTIIRVASSRAALGLIAGHRFGDPARAMKLVGVTGTNGKTTTTYLIESILRAAGRKPGVIGTVNYRYPGANPGELVIKHAPFTTPTALELHAVLAEMRAAGCTHVVMETSSHALALDRLAGLEFRVGAFTNLTQDHLDFHASMEDYFRAKSTLFSQLLTPSDGVGVIFLDSEYGRRMASSVVGERLLVSLSREGADVVPRYANYSIHGIEAELSSPMGPIRMRSGLVGQFNLANIVVAVAVTLALGADVQSIQKGIAALDGVPGRVERVSIDNGNYPKEFSVFVDYAHTHDALANVLAALRPLTERRILCVFGCGGDRDRTKRPRMGAVVAKGADLAIVTSDNPRTEEPHAIIDMILDGVREVGPPELAITDLAAAARGYHVEPDRRSAIEATVRAAGPGDVVLIAGKGHEDYQIIGRIKHPFDDRAVAREALGARRDREHSAGATTSDVGGDAGRGESGEPA